MSKRIVLKSLWAMVMVGFVLLISSCKKDVPPPTNLSVTDITETSAKLSWTGSADSYEIQLTNPQGANLAFTSSTNACSAANLTDNTTYTWKVRARKGNRYSDWVAGPSFTTVKKIHPIVGIWEFEKLEIKKLSCTNPLAEVLLKAMLQEYKVLEMITSIFDGTYEFTEDGKVTYQSSGETSDYAIEGNKLTIHGTDIIAGTFDYVITNKTMYWDVDVLDFFKEEYESLVEIGKGMGIEVTAFVVRITFTKQ